MDYRNQTTDPNDIVVDLSKHMEKLTQYEDISDDLSQEEEAKLIDYVRAASKMSFERISRRYDHWRDADRAHDVWVPADSTKFREKAVVADTRAIADTVLTYMMAALTGRNPMFQLEGMNRKSRRSALILERLLHQHMRRTAGEARLAQMLLDSIRYGFAPTKVIWDAKKNTNHIINFDPRRVFPDPRVNWGDWDRMQFVIFGDYVSTNALVSSGLYPKLNKYPGLRRKGGRKSSWDAHKHWREEGRGLSINPEEPVGSENGHHFVLDNARIVDEMWVRLQGYEVGVPGIEQLWMCITVVDEEAIIRCQLNPYGQQFPIVMGGLFQDSHKTFSQSLYDLLLPLHEVSSWLLRSRIDNVQAALNNLMFVDPTQVSIPDLIDRNPWGVVRTMPGAKPGDGVFIAQVPDVTKGHWNDIAAMSDLKQRVSAASDAQQGVPTADGIRTATEIARLTQLGSQRLGVLARIMSATTVRPMVRMMVQNLQDALFLEGSLKVDVDKAPGMLLADAQDGYVDFDVQGLQGSVDYLVIDGTLPIEPTRNAETWMNMLQIVNQSGLQMEYKAGKIVEEAIRAMGVSDLDQFRISEEEKQMGMTPSQQMAMMEKQRGVSTGAPQQTETMSQEQLMREAEAGNIVPMQGGGQ
tara:strand:+ start:2872 stop:4785 length:1914 start_codon:yes stop_codon:yes gene_type:complete